MSESKLQKKIIDWLKKNNFYVFKTIQCNRAGIPDIIACTPCGTFVGIEVKYGKNVASELQRYNIQEIQKRNGVAFVTWDLGTVISYLSEYL